MKRKHRALIERAIDDLAFLLMLGVMLWLAVMSRAAEAAVVQDPIPNNVSVRIMKGSSTLTRDPRTITADRPLGDPMPTLTTDNCVGIRNDIIRFDGLTRTTGANVYKCVVEYSAPVTFKANPTCPSPPPDQTRPGTCPAGTQGSWTQTGTTTYSAAPACAPTVTWRPVMPPEGACTPTPPPALPAPTGVTATPVSTSEIRVRWGIVPDAVAYSLRRCIGVSCDPLAVPALRCVQGLEQSHVSLNPGITVRYQVQAARTADCSGELSLPSDPPVSATTLATPVPPEQQPSSCVGRTCTLRWSYSGTPPAEGFRVVYGRSATTLPGSKQFTGGSLTAGEVTLTEGGTWFFAVIAFGGGNDSPLSNIITLTVQ